MSALHIELTLTAPALFLCHGQDRNTVDTWRRIPGAAIAGALAGRWLRQHREANADPTLHPEFCRLFLSGSVRYLHGYPADGQSRRLLPAPLSLRKHKTDGDADNLPLWDRACADVAEEDTKAADLGFVALAGTTLRWHQPKTRVHLHHTRDREYGLPDDRRSRKSIFHYRALDPGQRFVAVVLTTEPGDGALLRALLQEGPLLLGRSRGTEYGGAATVRILKEDAEFREVEFSNEDPEEDLVVTLLSEYVGAPGRGGSSQGLLQTLQEELGAALGGAALGAPDWARSHVHFQTLGGFIGSWHMPRPRVLALQAGSVLVWRGVSAPRSVLTLGERRAEGFGRVALGWHGAEAEHRREKVRFSTTQDLPIPAAARPLLRRMAREWLRQGIPACIDRLKVDVKRLPAPSVLGDLRADPERTLKQKRARAQLERCRVQFGRPMTMLELVQALEKNDFVLELLRPEQRRKEMPVLLQQLAPAELAAEAGALREALQDALLAELRRRAQRQEDGAGREATP